MPKIAPGKDFFLKKIENLCRVPNGVAPGKGWRQVAAFPPVGFADSHILPGAGFRQRINFTNGWTLPGAWLPAKAALPGVSLCWEPLCPAPNKECLCRVPNKKLPANYFTPGKSTVSRSDSKFLVIVAIVDSFYHISWYSVYPVHSQNDLWFGRESR